MHISLVTLEETANFSPISLISLFLTKRIPGYRTAKIKTVFLSLLAAALSYLTRFWPMGGKRMCNVQLLRSVPGNKGLVCSFSFLPAVLSCCETAADGFDLRIVKQLSKD